MQYRANPKNGDRLGALGFGCMRLPKIGGRIDQRESEKLLIEAIEQGVNYFDTAFVYQGSEKFLGQFLLNGWRDKIKIATKMPHFLVKLNAQFDMFFKTQLERLKTEYIDYYLIHSLSDIGVFEKLRRLGIEKWIEQRKNEGKIINIGFSFHGIEGQFESLIDAYPWDFCQIQYNYIDEYNQAGTAGLEYAAKKGLPVIVMGPVHGGRLADVPTEAKAIFDNTGYSPGQWALRWVLNHPEVTVALSGMSNKKQLDENLVIADMTQAMTAENFDMIKKVRQIILRDMKIHCTGCGYCMPCPAGVNIPECFSSYNEKYAFKQKNAWYKYMRNTGAMSYYPANASLCKNCGACVKHCPQSIQIPKELKQVSREFETPVFKIISKFGRAFMGNKKKKSK